MSRALRGSLLILGLAQHGCFLFCGKSKITFQNRCVYVRVHAMYVNGVKAGTARAGANFSYDAAAGTYVLEQRHASTTALAESDACLPETTTLPRCNEITLQCSK